VATVPLTHDDGLPRVTRFPAGSPLRLRDFSRRAARTGSVLATSLFASIGRDGLGGGADRDGNALGNGLNGLIAGWEEKTGGRSPGCPTEMARVDGFCVDRWEASLIEVLPNGEERRWSPFASVEPGIVVRAVSLPGAVPQGYISGSQAREACERSGKRLCRVGEWKSACMGPERTTWTYGNEEEPRRCNDRGRAPMGVLFGATVQLEDPSSWNWSRMNDPQLNQVPGTVSPTGSHEGCTNGYGVYDMVGNLHEWVADASGTFLGGYYLDTHLNGEGCKYRTGAHDFTYHDYSTGFRCCADPE
jgi:hypothetical protein